MWSPAIGYIQELETLTAKYRIKQYQHLAETDASTKASCEQDIAGIADQITEYAKKLDAIINSEKEAQKGKAIMRRQALHGMITRRLQRRSYS